MKQRQADYVKPRATKAGNAVRERQANRSKGVTMSVSHQNTVSKMDELIEARRHVRRLQAGLTAGVGHLDNPEALGGAHAKHRQDIRNLCGIMTDNEVIAFWQRESGAGHHFAADCILEWFAQ